MRVASPVRGLPNRGGGFQHKDFIDINWGDLPSQVLQFEGTTPCLHIQ